MGYLDINGRSNGKIRINYSESVDQSARKSTITITSVQVLSTFRTGHSFQPVGIITMGGRSITLTASNAVWVSGTNAYFTFANVPSISATFDNYGTGQRAPITLSPNGSGFSDFNVFCWQQNDGNIYIDSDTKYITLSTYSADSASTVTASSPVALGSNCSITINASKASYTHTLQYSLNQSSWTNIQTGVTAGTYSFNTGVLSGSFGTATQKACYIKCITYSGSSTVGSPSVTSTIVTAAGSPSVSNVTLSPLNDNSTVSGWNVYLQGYSRIRAVVSYSLPTGASLRSIEIFVNGTRAYSSSGVASGSTIDVPSVINSSGSVVVSTVVTDSRGNSGKLDKKITVLAYSLPYATVALAHRYSSNVNVEDKENGTKLSAKATMAYSSVNGKNTAGIRVRYKEVNGTYPSSYTTLTSGSANYTSIASSVSLQSSYIVQFIIYDTLHPYNGSGSTAPTIVEVTIPTKSVVLHSRDGGTGIAFGGYNSKAGVEHFWPTYLHDDLVLDPASYGTAAQMNAIPNPVEGQIYFVLSE